MVDKSTEKTVTNPDGTTDPVEPKTTAKTPAKTTAKAPADTTVDAEADRNAADADEAQEAPSAGPTVVQTKENTYTYPKGQGNTDPAVFEAFGEGGNFVEKRDR